jgi:hypothetical protein
MLGQLRSTRGPAGNCKASAQVTPSTLPPAGAGLNSITAPGIEAKASGSALGRRPARLGEQSSASGHGATRYLRVIRPRGYNHQPERRLPAGVIAKVICSLHGPLRSLRVGEVVLQVQGVGVVGALHPLAVRQGLLEQGDRLGGPARRLGVGQVVICLLTRCRTGLARMAATRGGYRRGRRSVLAGHPPGSFSR